METIERKGPSATLGKHQELASIPLQEVVSRRRSDEGDTWQCRRDFIREGKRDWSLQVFGVSVQTLNSTYIDTYLKD